MIRILLPANINFSTPTAKAKAILREYFPRISKHPTFSICFRHNTRACAMFSESSENKLSSPVHLVAVELKFWKKIRILTNLKAGKKQCFSLPRLWKEKLYNFEAKITHNLYFLSERRSGSQVHFVWWVRKRNFLPWALSPPCGPNSKLLPKLFQDANYPSTS